MYQYTIMQSAKCRIASGETDAQSAWQVNMLHGPLIDAFNFHRVRAAEPSNRPTYVVTAMTDFFIGDRRSRPRPSKHGSFPDLLCERIWRKCMSPEPLTWSHVNGQASLRVLHALLSMLRPFHPTAGHQPKFVSVSGGTDDAPGPVYIE